MIEVEMSKDIQDFSPKVIAFFDKRQLVCVGLAGLVGAAVYSATGFLSIDIRFTLVLLLAAPIAACGWVKLFGMPLDIFFLRCMLPIMMSPQKRKYVSENTYSYLDDDPMPTKEQMQLKRPKMKKAQRKKFAQDMAAFNAKE